MPFRKYAAASLDLQFREALHQWAKRFVRTDVAARRIVERTIYTLCDNPHLLDGPNINEKIFALLRRHAFDKNDLSASAVDDRRTVPTDEKQIERQLD